MLNFAIWSLNEQGHVKMTVWHLYRVGNLLKFAASNLYEVAQFSKFTVWNPYKLGQLANFESWNLYEVGYLWKLQIFNNDHQLWVDKNSCTKLLVKFNLKSSVYLEYICYEKHEKHSWRSVTFSKVLGFSNKLYQIAHRVSFILLKENVWIW